MEKLPGTEAMSLQIDRASLSRTHMSKARILIVEDDPSLGEVLEYNLREEGC